MLDFSSELRGRQELMLKLRISPRLRIDRLEYSVSRESKIVRVLAPVDCLPHYFKLSVNLFPRLRSLGEPDRR